MRNKNKKLELAQKNNTRVIYCNVPETQIMLDITNNIDRIYKTIRKNAGFGVDAIQAEKYRKDFLFIANNLECFLDKISNELNMEHKSNSILLKKIIEE